MREWWGQRQWRYDINGRTIIWSNCLWQHFRAHLSFWFELSAWSIDRRLTDFLCTLDKTQQRPKCDSNATPNNNETHFAKQNSKNIWSKYQLKKVTASSWKKTIDLVWHDYMLWMWNFLRKNACSMHALDYTDADSRCWKWSLVKKIRKISSICQWPITKASTPKSNLSFCLSSTLCIVWIPILILSVGDSDLCSFIFRAKNHLNKRIKCQRKLNYDWGNAN